jgi:hypothetical protein
LAVQTGCIRRADFYLPSVSHKDRQIESHVAPFRGRDLDPHYLAFVDCFNRQLYFEAHEVLEALWLPRRAAPDGDFYKGLIQLAGAFVHVQRARPQPAAALLKLARANLARYPAPHEQLDTAEVVARIDEWLRRIEAGACGDNPADRPSMPRLSLLPVT